MDTEAAKVIVREQVMVAGEDKLPEAVKSASAKVLQTFFDAIGVGAEATVAVVQGDGDLVEGIMASTSRRFRGGSNPWQGC